MQCSICRGGAILFQPYSGRYLCRDHFIKDLEARVKRAIRIHHGIRPRDHIGVVSRGDAASMALLFFLRNLTSERRDIRISAVTAGMRVESDSGITRLADATTLDDAAASVLTGILRGQGERCHLPTRDAVSALPIIYPFSHIPVEEITAYARLHGIEGKDSHIGETDRLFLDIKALLEGYTKRHPAAPHAVLNLGESLDVACRQDPGGTAGGA